MDARTFIRALEEDGYKRSDTFPIGTLKRMLEATRWTEDDLRRLGLIE